VYPPPHCIRAILMDPQIYFKIKYKTPLLQMIMIKTYRYILKRYWANKGESLHSDKKYCESDKFYNEIKRILNKLKPNENEKLCLEAIKTHASLIRYVKDKSESFISKALSANRKVIKHLGWDLPTGKTYKGKKILFF
jgi:hypothetical protein